jgi:hypothetical protein
VITTIPMLVDAAYTAFRICGSIQLAQRSPAFSAYKRRAIVFGAVLFTDEGSTSPDWKIILHYPSVSELRQPGTA